MLKSHRGLPFAALAIAGVAAIAGCGGASSKSSTRPEPPITKAQATAFANQVNLQPADMQGWRASLNSAISSQDAQLAKCAGTSAPSEAVADVSSNSFDRGSALSTQGAASSVKVVQNKSTVTSDLATTKSAKAQSCIKALLPRVIQQIAGNQVKFGAPQIETLSPSVAGADGSYGYRITFAAEALGQQFPFVIDVLGAAVGRAELSLDDFGIGNPLPPADEQRLLSMLVSRSNAHRL
jgi:hypothetical protein